MELALRKHTSISVFEQIQLAQQVIRDEAGALDKLSQKIPADFPRAVERLADCRGNVIVTGIGKAGWIAQKISASLASTGTRSHYLHPSEAMHGDLGRVGKDDVLLVLSNSGETSEVIQILPTIAKLNVPVIAITNNSNSTLAKNADCILDYGKTTEACPLGLAPTTSTTVMLALGDALAMVVAKTKNLRPQDFARSHPGGNLGKKLSNVTEIMRPISECRVASDQRTVREIYIELAGPSRRSGAVLLVDERRRLTGIFTDSDLARLLERQQDECFDRPVREVMTREPNCVAADAKTKLAVEILASNNISELPVVDEAMRPVGLIDVTDVVGLFPLEK